MTPSTEIQPLLQGFLVVTKARRSHHDIEKAIFLCSPDNWARATKLFRSGQDGLAAGLGLDSRTPNTRRPERKPSSFSSLPRFTASPASIAYTPQWLSPVLWHAQIADNGSLNLSSRPSISLKSPHLHEEISRHPRDDGTRHASASNRRRRRLLL